MVLPFMSFSLKITYSKRNFSSSLHLSQRQFRIRPFSRRGGMKGVYLTQYCVSPSPSASTSSSRRIAGFRQKRDFKVSTSVVSVALMRRVCNPFGSAFETPWRSSSYPYDSTRSASSITRWVSCEVRDLETLMWTRALEGVETIMSCFSERRDLEIFSARRE